MLEEKWIIWSVEHNGYVAFDGRGFTMYHDKASQYSKSKAEEIIKEASIKGKKFEMVKVIQQ